MHDIIFWFPFSLVVLYGLFRLNAVVGDPLYIMERLSPADKLGVLEGKLRCMGTYVPDDARLLEYIDDLNPGVRRQLELNAIAAQVLGVTDLSMEPDARQAYLDERRRLEDLMAPESEWPADKAVRLRRENELLKAELAKHLREPSPCVQLLAIAEDMREELVKHVASGEVKTRIFETVTVPLEVMGTLTSRDVKVLVVLE